MSQGSTTPGRESGPQAGAARSLPVAAIAGAVVLAGLIGFALYRRASAPAGAPAPGAGPAGGAAASGDANTPGEPGAGTGAEQGGATIAVQAPIRLTPEAAILAERYRCVCGCNDPLGLCTCRLPNGSEDMKAFLQDQAKQGRTPQEIDQAMTERFGPAALMSNPAPPQTLPSHAAPR